MTFFQYDMRFSIMISMATIVFAFNINSLFAQEEPLLPENDQCIICHTEEEYLPEDFSKHDIHLQQGLSCAGCHGGDPTLEDMDESMSPEAGFVGVPTKSEIPQFCGKCHSDINVMREYQPRIPTDQVDQYYTSIHGKKLKEGDKKVADCTGCHTGHAILPASDPRSTVYALEVPETCHKCHSDAEYMAPYGIPTDQYEKYAKSVHGKALLEDHDTGSPACNDCHGNHGAIPPGVASVSHVCGTCHVNNMQYYSTTKMAEEFEAEGVHGCEQCHGNHLVEETSDAMVGIGEKSVCTDCHAEGDDGYEAAKEIHSQLTSLVALYDSAKTKQEKVRRIGMDDVDIEFQLQESHQSLIQARTLVHTFSAEKVAEKTDEGIEKARQALEMAQEEIKENQVRRLGFGVATLFITVLVVALFFKVRDIEKRQKNS